MEKEVICDGKKFINFNYVSDYLGLDPYMTGRIIHRAEKYGFKDGETYFVKTHPNQTGRNIKTFFVSVPLFKRLISDRHRPKGMPPDKYLAAKDALLEDLRVQGHTATWMSKYHDPKKKFAISYYDYDRKFSRTKYKSSAEGAFKYAEKIVDRWRRLVEIDHCGTADKTVFSYDSNIGAVVFKNYFVEKGK